MAKGKEKLDIAVDLYVDNIYVKHTPKYSWHKALQECGYSKSYARARTCELWARAKDKIAARKEKIEAVATWDLDWIDQEFRSLYDECRESSDKTNAKGVLEAMTRRKGGFTDNTLTGELTAPTISQADTDKIDIPAIKLKLARTGS